MYVTAPGVCGPVIKKKKSEFWMINKVIYTKDSKVFYISGRFCLFIASVLKDRSSLFLFLSASHPALKNRMNRKKKQIIISKLSFDELVQMLEV